MLILKNKYQRKKAQLETNHVASQYTVISKLKLHIKEEEHSALSNEIFFHTMFLCDAAVFLPYVALFMPFSKKVRVYPFTSFSVFRVYS